MANLSTADRIRRALVQRDPEEIAWAMEHARSRAEAATDPGVANYWREILRRLEDALTA